MSKESIYLPYEVKEKYCLSEIIITKTKNLAKKITFGYYQWRIWQDCIMDEIKQQKELASQYPQYVLGIKDYFYTDRSIEIDLYLVYDCDQDAKNLFEYIRNNNYSIQQKQIYKIFEQVLNLGIIVNQIEHRNIKTGNIIFNKGNVMLSDFGSARTHYLNFTKDFTKKQEKRWQIEGLFYCCRDFVNIINSNQGHDDWQQLFENENQAVLHSQRNDFWGLMIYALRIFSNCTEIDYQINSIWSINKQNLQAQLMKVSKYKSIHAILYDALINNPENNYENNPRYYLDKFIVLIQQNNDETYDFEQQLLNQEDNVLMKSKTINKNKKFYLTKQEIQLQEEIIKQQDSQRQQQATQEGSNSNGENRIQALGNDSIFDQETHRYDEVQFPILNKDTFTTNIQYNPILQLQDLRKLNPQDYDEYKKELQSQKSQTNSQPILQQILVNLETVEELNRIKFQIDQFITAPNHNKILQPRDLQQLSVQEREELKQNIQRIQSQPQYQDVKGILGKQLEIIDEVLPQEKLLRFINNPSKENLVNVLQLNEAEVEQKEQFKDQLPILKNQYQEMEQIITKQIQLVDETDEIQEQLRQIKADPQRAQFLQISNLTKMSDDQLADYKKTLQQIQTRPNSQQEQILSKLSQVEEIEQNRQQLKNIISNPQSGQIITTTGLLKLGQDNLDLAIKQLNLIRPDQIQQNQQIPQNLQAAQHAKIICENLQRLKNQPQMGNLLQKSDIKELPDDILDDYKKRIQKINPSKREEQDMIIQQIKQIEEIQENKQKLKQFIQDPKQVQLIEKIDIKSLNNEDLYKIKQQLEILNQDNLPKKQNDLILQQLKKVEDQIRQNTQNQKNIVQQQEQLLTNPINLLLADNSELNKIQEQLNKNNKQDKDIVNKLKDLIKLKEDNVPYYQILKNPLIKELIQIQQQNPGKFQPISPDNIRKEDYIQRQVQQQQNDQILPQNLTQINQKPFGFAPSNQQQQININPQNQSDPLKVAPQLLSFAKLYKLQEKNPQLLQQYQQHLEKLIIQHRHLQDIAQKQLEILKLIIAGQKAKQLTKKDKEFIKIFGLQPGLINDNLFDIPETKPLQEIQDPRPQSIVQINDEPERQQLVPKKNIKLLPLPQDQRNRQVRPINDPPVPINIVINIRGEQQIFKNNDQDFYNQLGEEFYTVDLDWDVLSNNEQIRQFQLKLREVNYKLIIPKQFQIDTQDRGRLSENYQHQANGVIFDTKYGGQWKDELVPDGYGIMMRKKNGSIYQGIFQNKLFVYGFVIELSGKNIQFYTGFYDQDKQLKLDKDCLMIWIKQDKNSFEKVEEHKGPIFMNNFVGKGQRKYYKNKQAEIYDGQWLNNKRHGEGILNFGTSKYVGQFQNDLYHGKGRYCYDDSLYEDGEYIEGKRVGIHTLYKIETVNNKQEIIEQKKIDYSKKFFCF